VSRTSGLRLRRLFLMAGQALDSRAAILWGFRSRACVANFLSVIPCFVSHSLRSRGWGATPNFSVIMWARPTTPFELFGASMRSHALRETQIRHK
jgi:hypothetical protein